MQTSPSQSWYGILPISVPTFYQLCPENLRYFTVAYATPKTQKTAGNTKFPAVNHSF